MLQVTGEELEFEPRPDRKAGAVSNSSCSSRRCHQRKRQGAPSSKSSPVCRLFTSCFSLLLGNHTIILLQIVKFFSYYLKDETHLQNQNKHQNQKNKKKIQPFNNPKQQMCRKETSKTKIARFTVIVPGHTTGVNHHSDQQS